MTPAHVLIPAICEAVKRGNVQRGTIRAALKADGVAIGDSTLSSLLRLAVAQGALFRTGDKRGARYAPTTWRRRKRATIIPEPVTFEDL